MEGRVSHNKKSAALILSVLLPFSPTPRLYGDPFDKKHKDPKGAGGVKKCNGVRRCYKAGFWGQRSSPGRFAPVTPFPIMKLLRRAGILHHQQDPPPSAFWSHYCWECWAKINLICFSLLLLLLLLNFYLVVVLCWDPFSQACAWMDATAVLSESIGLKAEASAKRNYCCCNNMKSKQ